ncbi:MAG: hypothetical protein JNN21_03400 [Candidatus Accumulibacter sp.]|nr:hypothetical protein [Accumulibacter sp.]
MAFKPNTEDLREAPIRTLLTDLFAAEAAATACDPLAMATALRVSSDEV